MAKTKYVYFFGNGDAEGDETMRPILGGKGANLAQMAKAPLSLPVPPGFTISIDVCQEYRWISEQRRSMHFTESGMPYRGGKRFTIATTAPL